MSFANSIHYNREEITAYVKQVCTQAMISEKQLADQMDVRVVLDIMSRQLVVQLKYFLAHERVETITVAADWWSGLKLALFGERYWEILPFIKPPEMVRFEVDAEYPNYKLPEDIFGQRVIRISKAAFNAVDEWVVDP